MDKNSGAAGNPAPSSPSELSAAGLVRMASGFREAKVLLSGVELGVFDALAAGRLTPDVLAQRLRLPCESLRRLLVALCSLALLEKRGDAYANTVAAQTFLVRSSPACLAAGFHHLDHDLYPLFTFLSDAVREDRNQLTRAFPGGYTEPFAALYRDEAGLRGFLEGLAAGALPAGRALGEHLDFSRFHCLLDIGGALGALTVGVLQSQPHLCGAVFDLPQVAPLATEYVVAAGLADRIQVVAGDMFVDALPEGADVITLRLILHDWGDAACRPLLAKCHSALPSGGALIVLESVLSEEGTGPRETALGDLTMLVVNEGGRNRTAAEYCGLVREAGFVRTALLPLNPAAPAERDRQCIIGWKA